MSEKMEEMGAKLDGTLTV